MCLFVYCVCVCVDNSKTSESAGKHTHKHTQTHTHRNKRGNNSNNSNKRVRVIILSCCEQPFPTAFQKRKANKGAKERKKGEEWRLWLLGGEVLLFVCFVLFVCLFVCLMVCLLLLSGPFCLSFFQTATT